MKDFWPVFWFFAFLLAASAIAKAAVDGAHKELIRYCAEVYK